MGRTVMGCEESLVNQM